MLKKWEKVSEKTIIKNSHWSYKVDNFIIDNNFNGEYHYVHSLGSTMVVPIASSGKILLTNQYRYLNGKESWEFPCGSVSDNLSIYDNAIKELREESGYSAKSIEKIGEFAPYTGASDEICSVYIAKELFPSPLPADETEDFEIDFFTKDEIEKLVDTNLIWDGLTLAAWSLVKNRL